MSLVETEDRGPVRHVVLNRPDKRNAFNNDLIFALGDAVAEAAADPEVTCIVLRGEGKVFSAGIDLGQLMSVGTDTAHLRPFRRRMLDVWNLVEETAKPVVCQIHGACLGAGMELALACDLRVMADDAVMGLPETRLGLIPDVGGSSRLPAVVGLGRAKELIMTSRNVDAIEAERIGLVNRIAPAAKLDAATDLLVGQLLECNPLAVGLSKRILDAAAKPALSTTLELEVALQQACVDALAAKAREAQAQAETAAV